MHLSRCNKCIVLDNSNSYNECGIQCSFTLDVSESIKISLSEKLVLLNKL